METPAGKTEGVNPMRWGIFDRLKNLPILSTSKDSGIISSKPKVETKKTVEKETVTTEIKEVKETVIPEEEKWDMLAKYENIPRNEFTTREHVVQNEDDIAVCVCAIESECREFCLNTLTSVECTVGHCPCGNLCQNQKFQKGDYAKVKLVKTEGRGWGLLADQDIKEGNFVIEYCGEVVSDKVAQSRVQVYEEAGVKEKYIISLDGNDFLDATRKGSLARFINHSCEPNCVTRKWTVLGEVRIGIFALEDIKAGEELTYDYNFQWYGGAKIRCQCGTPSCVGFLGAKSPGFQRDVIGFDGRINSESTREDASSANDDVPLRFSSNQELLDQLYAIAVGVRDFQVAGAKSKLTQLVGEVKNKRVRIKKEIFEKPEKTPKSDKKDPTLKKTSSNEKTSTMTEKKSTVKLAVKKSEMQTPQKSLVMQWITPQFDVTPLAKVSPQSGFAKKPSKLKTSSGKSEDEETRITKKSARKNDARPRAEGQSASKKKARLTAYQQTKNMVNQRIHALSLTHQTLSEAATAEVAAAQKEEVAAAAEMTKLLEEIRGIMKDREKGDYDALPIDLTERWIAATTKQLRTSFDFHFTVVRSMVGPTSSVSGAEVSSHHTVT